MGFCYRNRGDFREVATGCQVAMIQIYLTLDAMSAKHTGKDEKPCFLVPGGSKIHVRRLFA